MALGKNLLREKWSPAERGSALLLNTRLPSPLRERVLTTAFPDLEDHVWVATSGTGGKLKLVALSRDALEASARAVNRHLASDENDLWINPLPLFHVGGLGMLLRAHLSGARHMTFGQPWNAVDFTSIAAASHATLSALVPAQVHDLVRARCRAPRALRAVIVGGGALTDDLYAEALALGWPLLPSYGLTEAASQVATARPGEPRSEWLPLLEHIEARADEQGALELRGASLLTGWTIFDAGGGSVWEDPRREGWYRTSDRAELRGRELSVLGRLDDLVKIRGELVDLAALERALQARVKSGAAMLRCVPDERNGLTLHITAENETAVAEVRQAQDEVFPPYARPQEIKTGRIERTALGKLVSP
jgi:O-succinylbenzoic acid--CoA ligase